MRIRVYSDLHLEFLQDPRRFINELPNDCDVLVLAGDIDNDGILGTLERFSRRFDNVVYVAGNHEFYGREVDVTLARLDDVAAFDNVHWLDRSIVQIGSLGPDGQRFLGATLWFEWPPAVTGAYQSDPRVGMTDFSVILGFEPWVYRANERAKAWLKENVQPGDIVVTHHLPSPRSVHPKYVGSPLNRFFLGTMTLDLEELMRERKPALWVHGHTHESCDYSIDETRVVCNPYGYHGQEVNPRWDAGFTVEVT